jgi:hypothetical protein
MERGQTLTKKEYYLKTGITAPMAPLRIDLFGKFCYFDRTQGHATDAYIKFSPSLSGVTDGEVVKSNNYPEEPVDPHKYKTFQIPDFDWLYDAD